MASDTLEKNSPTAGSRTGRPLGYLLLTALFLVGIPGLFGFFLLEHLDREAVAETRRREHDDIREILGQIAARGNLQRRFQEHFGRLSRLAWQLPVLAERLARTQKQFPGLIDVYLFQPTGQRLPLPGLPEQYVFASQQFLKTLMYPDKPASEKLLKTFAGNAGAASLMSGAPETLVELMNGGKNTWGGWWRLRDRRGGLIGHLVAFVHRQGISPARFMDQAVEETNRLIKGRFVCGWKDPLQPAELFPGGRAYPAGLAHKLNTLTFGETALEWNGLSLAVYLTEEGEMLFGVANRPPPRDGFFASCRWYLLGFLGLAYVLLVRNLAGLASLRSKLVWQMAIAGGFPLAVFLSTVLIDRQDRELLLEKQICDSHLEFLTKLDGNSRSEFFPMLRAFQSFFRRTRADPERLVPKHADALHRAVQRQRGLTTRCMVVTKDGTIMFYHQFADQGGGLKTPLPNEGLPFAALNILQSVNKMAPTSSTAALSNPIMDLMVATKYAPAWLDENGLLKANQMGKENVLSFFRLFPEQVGSDLASATFKAVLMATQDSRLGQIRYLRRKTLANTRMGLDAPRLFAIPVAPGGKWPSFPDERMNRNPMIRKLCDLVLTGALPQHHPVWFGGRKYLVSALRGHFLDGYILMLARPYAAISNQTKVLAHRAAVIAGFMLLLALGAAWGSARMLLEPLRHLGHGLTALKARQFAHRLPPGSLEELAVVSHRFNQILEGLGDLEMARSVQETLWPAQGMAGADWRIDGHCVTASELGGDFYDWFLLPDGRLVLAVGDVAGHGIPSSLVAASAKVELAMNTEMELDPAKILIAMNAGLLKQAGRKRPMSFWMGIYDPVTRLLQYSNAGQNFPVALINGEDPKMVEGKGYPLGARQKPGYTTGTVDFSKGGRLFAYSDGIVEAHTIAGDPYDYSRFTALTQKHRSTPVQEAIKDVFEQVRTWSNRDVPEDDQTLVILDVGEKP